MPDYESYDLSGGVNQRLSPLKLMPNELADAQNVLPEERGSIQRRYGFAKFNAVQVEAGDRIDGLFKFYSEHDAHADALIAACGGRLYSVPTTGASTDLGLDHDGNPNYTIEEDYPCFMVEARDNIFGVSWKDEANNESFVIGDHPDGTGNLLAWNSVMDAPAADIVLADSSSGDMDPGGVYSYKIAYFYGANGSLGESNAGSAVEITLGGGVKACLVTFFGGAHDYADFPAAFDAGISKVRIYRTDGGGTTFKFLVDIDGTDDDTVVSYDDLLNDSALDSGTTPQTDHGTGNHARFIAYHNSRIFDGNIYDFVNSEHFAGRVRWSLAGFPATFPANNYSDAPGDYGHVMGLAVLNGTLFVFYESAIASLTVQYESTHTYRVATTKAGVKAVRSLVIGKERGRDVAFFLSYDHQVYVFDGQEARAISDDVHPILSSDANQSAMEACAGGWDGEYYYLSYPDGTDTVPSAELRYNTQVRKQNIHLGYDTGTWWPQALPSGKAPNVYHQLHGASDAGELYWGNSGATGWIFQHNSGNSDDSANISSMFQTGLNHLGSGSYEKALRDLLVDMQSFTALTYRWDLDFDTKAGSFQIPESTDIPEYDTGLYYDDGHYYVGEAPTRTKYPFRNVYEGMRFRAKVTGNEQNAPYKVYGWTVRFTIAREDKAS